jgi:hypothetical protein
MNKRLYSDALDQAMANHGGHKTDFGKCIEPGCRKAKLELLKIRYPKTWKKYAERFGWK